MSAEAVVYALLTGAGPVTSMVGTSVYPTLLPEGVKPAPGIVYGLISAVRVPVIDATAPTHLTRSRVQVDLVGPDFAQLRTLRNAVVAALQFQRGAIGGTEVNAVFHAGDGPVSFDERLGLYHRPIDFLIHHQQP